MKKAKKALIAREVLLVAVSLSIIFLIRFIYHANNPLYFYYPDSYQYLNRAQEMAKGLPIIHYQRTPVYPLILKHILNLKGDFIDNLKTINWVNYQHVIRFQSIFGLVGAAFFVYLAFQVFEASFAFFFVCLLFGFNLHIFGWEKNILTESITSTTLLGFLFLIFRFIESRKLIHLFLAVLASSLLFLIRPVFLFFLFFLSPFIVYFLFKDISKKKRHFLIFTVIIFSFLSLTPSIFYALQNKRLHGFFGVTNILQQDLLAKSIQYHLDASGVDKGNVYAPHLKSCIDKHTPGTWVGTNECLYGLKLENDHFFIRSATIAGSFAKKVILKHPLEYVVKTFKILPEVLASERPDPFYWVSNYSVNLKVWEFWKIVDKLYDVLQKFMLSFYVFYPGSLFLFLRFPSKKNTFLILLGNTVFYQLFFNAVFTQTDYFRLRAPILPELLFFCSYYYYKIVITLGKKIKV